MDSGAVASLPRSHRSAASNPDIFNRFGDARGSGRFHEERVERIAELYPDRGIQRLCRSCSKTCKVLGAAGSKFRCFERQPIAGLGKKS